MKRPETRYAWNGEVSLAYQVVGDADVDLLYLQGYCSNVDMNWERPYLARFLRALTRHARLIVIDRRGWGCSERFTPGSVPDVDLLTDSGRSGSRCAQDCTQARWNASTARWGARGQHRRTSRSDGRFV